MTTAGCVIGVRNRSGEGTVEMSMNELELLEAERYDLDETITATHGFDALEALYGRYNAVNRRIAELEAN
jgi:hypothetical protein